MKLQAICIVAILLVKVTVTEQKLLSLEFGQSDPIFAKRLRRAASEIQGSGSGSEPDDNDEVGSGSGEDQDGSGSGDGAPNDNEKGGDCEGSGGSGGCDEEVFAPTTKKTIVSTKTTRKQITTKKPTIVDINTTKQPTKTSGAATTTTKPQDNKIDNNNVKPTVSQNETNNQVQNGAVVDSPNNQNNVDKAASEGVDFQNGIIIGVVVGGILAILIILFLVYRIRKKDSGSYILDEKSSHDPMLQDDDSQKGGKEYFA